MNQFLSFFLFIHFIHVHTLHTKTDSRLLPCQSSQVEGIACRTGPLETGQRTSAQCGRFHTGGHTGRPAKPNISQSQPSLNWSVTIPASDGRVRQAGRDGDKGCWLGRLVIWMPCILTCPKPSSDRDGMDGLRKSHTRSACQFSQWQLLETINWVLKHPLTHNTRSLYIYICILFVYEHDPFTAKLTQACSDAPTGTASLRYYLTFASAVSVTVPLLFFVLFCT